MSDVFSCPVPKGTDVMVSALPNVRSHQLQTVNLFEQLSYPTAFHEDSWLDALDCVRRYYRKELSGGNYTPAQYHKYKSMKAQLPVMMPAGEFSARRDDALLRPSGFMQFDIDAKDNPGRDLDESKWILAEMEQVAYVGKSVSGEGLWGLVRISNPSVFRDQGRRLLLHLKHHTGVVFDEPVTLRKSGLRLFSYDERAWINPIAKPFDLLTPEERPRINGKRPRLSSDSKSIETLLSRIEAAEVDITCDYHDWIRIMYALSTSFGPDGLHYAQRLSQFHAGYDPGHVEHKFLDIDSKRRHPVSIKEVARIAETHWK